MQTAEVLSYIADGAAALISLVAIFGGRSKFLQTKADTTIRYLTQENDVLTSLNAQLNKDRVEDRKRIVKLERQVAELQGMVRQTPEITALTQQVAENHVELTNKFNSLLEVLANKEATNVN